MTNTSSEVEKQIDHLIGKYRMGFVVGDKDITTYYMDFKKEILELITKSEIKGRISELYKLQQLSNFVDWTNPKIRRVIAERMSTLNQMKGKS